MPSSDSDAATPVSDAPTPACPHCGHDRLHMNQYCARCGLWPDAKYETSAHPSAAPLDLDALPELAATLRRYSVELADTNWSGGSCGANLIDDAADAILALVAAARRGVADTELLAAIRKHCRVVYYPPNGEYPIEHAPHASGGDAWNILAPTLAALPPEAP